MMAPNGVELLIKQSQAAFNSGEKDYHEGHLVQAREEFDQSLDELLSSGFDIEGNPRLGQLYHNIVELVNQQELAAFRQGDGFQEQESAPAPIDEIADQTIPQPENFGPSLRDRAEGEVRTVPHDLPLTVNNYVLTYLNFFRTPKGSEIVEKGLTRAGRYRKMVERVLGEEGIPQDLIYLAQAESAFQPRAVSRAGARGMWQFMSYSGRKYGLERTWWVDQRQDPEEATRAAARYLRDLYNQFGDWYLAMAAYNSGAATVQHAIERTGYANFWELYRRNVLPRETKNYVPIILALTLISKDPARYGIHVKPDPPQKFDAVKPGKPIDLRLVAEATNTNLDTLLQLNPELLRLVTPDDPNFVLHIPEGTAERFFAEIAAIPSDKWVSWRRHRVRRGETLSVIARRYHVRTRSVAEANGISLRTPLQVDEELIIPVAAWSQPSAGELMHYRVRRGDTLSSIADRFNVSIAALKKWNHLRSSLVRRGARLRVYPGGKNKSIPPFHMPTRMAALVTAPGGDSLVAPAADGKVVTHHVHQGETLWSIARAYRTTVEAIRSGNRYLFSRPLQVGDTLTILPPR